MSKRTAVKVGDKVRARRNNYHYAKFGAVGTVVWVGQWDVEVLFPRGAMLAGFDNDSTQYIEHADLLHAPQANKRSK